MTHALLFLVDPIAGAMNAVAGGGWTLTFPDLVYTGVSPIAANASGTIALFPRSLASAWKFREHICPFAHISIIAMTALT